MNRRWQKDGRGRYETLPHSYGAFAAGLPPLPSSLGLCDTADLYATFSMLHAKDRPAELKANKELGFYYFLVVALKQPTNNAQLIDQPATLGEVQNSEALDTMTTKPEHSSGQAPSLEHESLGDAAPSNREPDAPLAMDADARMDSNTIAQQVPLPLIGLLSKDGKLLEPVVPVSSKCVYLTMERMQQLFYLGQGVTARQFLLAIVDDDGSVALTRMFNSIQPPEGPESSMLDAKDDSD